MKTTIAQWIGVGGGVCGLLNAIVAIGMWVGPLNDMPQRFDKIATRLDELQHQIGRLTIEHRDRPRCVRLD